MTIISIQFLTRLSAAVTDAQAAMVAATALDEGADIRTVGQALIEKADQLDREVQVIER